MFEIMPNSNSKNFTEKSEKVVSLWCLFEKKNFCRRPNRKVGKRGENLKYVFQIEIEIATFVLEMSRDIFRFSNSRNQKGDFLQMIPSALS